MPNPKALKIIVALASMVGYYFLGYETPRENFWQLLLLFGGLFVCYGVLVMLFRQKGHWVELLVYALVFRLLLLFMTPNLSDDFYRFFWDGTLTSHEHSAFELKPSEIVGGYKEKKMGLTEEVYQKLNSKDYYSLYPPINQVIFFLGATASNKSPEQAAIIMRIILLLFELGVMIMLFKLCRQFGLEEWKAGLYLFNPLVIMEVVGNIHFEGVMVFFLLIAIYRMAQGRFMVSAANFALAISTKFLPLMFLPFLFKRLRWKRAIYYCLIVGMICFILFTAMLMSGNSANVLQSLDLYFQTFEFNASVWNVVRAIGFAVVDYNILQTAGPLLGGGAFVVIVTMAFREKSASKQAIFTTFLLVLSVYYLSSPIVHPWYIVPLVAFSVFSHFRYAILWSFAVLLSYYAYSNPDYAENYWLVGGEYSAVLAYFIWEVVRMKRVAAASLQVDESA